MSDARETANCSFTGITHISEKRERTGLVVRVSDSGSGDPGSILGRVGVLFPESESESARYSIHLRESITWSACGNGQKKNEKKRRKE